MKLNYLKFLVFLIFTASCGLPRDPEKTLERTEQTKILRVGVIKESPWICITQAPVFAIHGVEARIVHDLAQALGVQVQWNIGGETRLMDDLKKFNLDLVVGGLHYDSPYQNEVGFTSSYYHDDNRIEHVLAAPPGENAWIIRIDRFLDLYKGKIPTLIREESKFCGGDKQ